MILRNIKKGVSWDSYLTLSTGSLDIWSFFGLFCDFGFVEEEFKGKDNWYFNCLTLLKATSPVEWMSHKNTGILSEARDPPKG